MNTTEWLRSFPDARGWVYVLRHVLRATHDAANLHDRLAIGEAWLASQRAPDARERVRAFMTAASERVR